ncbi:TIGR04282 family arsenosugar biosynthesis glycosyltransferase [Plantactinospora sp. WMMC1484]|uniref:TIGR04282 family arsenosugar biosynthesis glycosyltransferase n=1 Tax=Plantactinospora sp. WMMC1484 TaxID=3404122 RepID=UPI003BF56A79
MNILLVVAKAPVPGLAKTRLCPPASPEQAARIAAAALLATLAAVRATAATIPVLAHTGRFTDAEYADELAAALTGWHLLPQHGDTLADRLAHAHAEAGAAFPGRPVLQVGMDTPQLSPGTLSAALDRLADADAVLGPAVDGGWWALGLRDPGQATALRPVPTSTPQTGRQTLTALRARGLRVAILPVLRDVDDWDAARAVAADLPGSRFARALHETRTVVTEGA